MEKDPESASLLWPEDEWRWIAQEGCWAKRASYHAETYTQNLIRELLQEICDLRSLRELAEAAGAVTRHRDPQMWSRWVMIPYEEIVAIEAAAKQANEVLDGGEQ